MKARQKLECKQCNLQTMGYLGLQTANGQLDKHVGIHIYIYIYIYVYVYTSLSQLILQKLRVIHALLCLNRHMHR